MRLRPLAALLLLAACTQEEMLERFASKEDQAAAKARVEQLRARDFAGIEKDLDASLKGPSLRPTLETMAGAIPAGAPTSVTLVGAHQFSSPGSTSKNITFEYNFGGKWLLINVATKETNGTTTLVGLNVNPIAQSLEEHNRFTLSGKSAKHFAVLGAAVVAALFSLYALVVCIRTKLPGRKWPWILFILLGIGKVGLNWTTGEVLFAPLSVQLFSAGAAAALYGPWVVSFSLPLGAAIFLIRQRSPNEKPVGA